MAVKLTYLFCVDFALLHAMVQYALFWMHTLHTVSSSGGSAMTPPCYHVGAVVHYAASQADVQEILCFFGVNGNVWLEALFCAPATRAACFQNCLLVCAHQLQYTKTLFEYTQSRAHQDIRVLVE